MTNVTSPPDTAAETAALEALADLLPRKKYVASLERIAAVADLEKAAEVISNVLRMIGPSS